MIEGKTINGFEFEIDERSLNDWRLTKAIANANSPDESVMLKAATTLVEILLGDKGEAKLMDFIAGRNDGYIPTDKILAEVTNIFHACKEIKNS